MLRTKGKILLDKVDIERAMRATQSNKQAARNLGVSYTIYKKFAKMFTDEAGVSLFEKHKNISGKGIPKMALRKNRGTDVGIIDILEGRINPTIYSFKKIKERIVKEGLLEEKCNRCGFHEHRVLDLKVPVILSYKDGNKRNLKYENLEFLCYNCYFLTIGDIFEKRQLEVMEDYAARYNTTDIDMELEPEQEKAVEVEINKANELPPVESYDARPEDFGDDLIAFTKRKR